MAEGRNRELSRTGKGGIALIIVATLGGSYAIMGGGDTTTAEVPGAVAEADPAPATDPPSPASEADTDGVRFSDQSESAGFTTPHSLQDLFGVQAQTSGAAAADVFGTGRSDLYVTRVGAANSLYRNDGDGTFTDVAAELGLEGPDPGQGSSAAAFADVNADGCPDLYMSGALRGRSALYMNDCDGAFADETVDRGLGLYTEQVYSTLLRQDHGVTFADYDNNGTLDLLVLQWDPSFDEERTDGEGEPCLPAGNQQPSEDTNRSRLWSNDGEGNFTDVTEQMGLRLDALAGFTGQFTDVDGDTWPDLLIAGDFCTSRLYRNDGGTGFTDVTNESGVGAEENGMGSVISDVNGDGAPDWFVTSIGHPNPDGDCAGLTWNGCSGNHLYVNDGTGKFSNEASKLGVQQGWWGWGSAIEDFSGDGGREIIQANGFIDPETRQQKYFTPEQIAVYEQFTEDPLRYWVMTDDGYQDAAALVGLSNTDVTTCVVPLDYDADGDLDVFVCRPGDTPLLYRNDRPTDRPWITVALNDPTMPGNAAGIGATVAIVSGGERDVGWIDTSGSFESQKPAERTVGVASADPLSVEVTWPGDDVPETFDDVATDQRHVLVRGAGSVEPT